MKQYTVDFRGVKTYQEFYERIVKGMEFPEWCGYNADAVWDLLTGHAEYPAKITIYGIRQLPKALDRNSNLIAKVFQDAEVWFSETNTQFKVQFIDE